MGRAHARSSGDGSVRDWQWHTHQFTPGKNFVATGAFGPRMVSADQISPGEELTLTTRLNGQVMQQTTPANMIFPIPRLIAYCSILQASYRAPISAR